MKNIFKLYVFLLTMIRFNSVAQSNVTLSYDASGNLIQRQVQVLPELNNKLSAPKGANSQVKDSTSFVPFTVYPNPTKDVINIEGPLPDGAQNGKISLLNNNGQLMQSDSYDGTKKQMKINELKPGIYYLEIRYAKEKASTYKIVVIN